MQQLQLPGTIPPPKSSWKNRLSVIMRWTTKILVSFSFFSLFLIIGTLLTCTYFLLKQYEPDQKSGRIEKTIEKKKEDIQTTKEYNVIFSLNGTMDSQVIRNGIIDIKKGEVLTIGINDKGKVLKTTAPWPLSDFFGWQWLNSLLLRVLPVKILPIQELVYFKAPGEKEKQWLNEERTTTYIAREDGKIEFGMDYHVPMTRFQTQSIDGQAGNFFKPGFVSLDCIVRPSNSNDKTTSEEVVRPEGLISIVAPDYKTENKLPDRNLTDVLIELAPTVKGEYSEKESE